MTAGSAARPLATVFGGGGVFGIAYNLGVAEAFVDAGFDLGAAPAIGTSAGSWAAAHLALGLRFNAVFDIFRDEIPRRPDPRPGRLVGLARSVFGWQISCPSVRVSAVALPRLQRRLLDGGEHPIADLVAASSSVPGMLAPHRIDGVRYLDGGIRSMASADLGDAADRLLVVLPMSGPMFGPAGRLIERRTLREVDAWHGRHPGSEVTIVRPTPRIAGMIWRPDQLFDPARARDCYHLAYRQGVELAAAWARPFALAA